MAIEIERKFLVKSLEFIDLAFESKEIKQGYISKSSNANVRVRIYGDDGFITIKGKSDEKGLKRHEWEYKVPKEDATELLGLCNGNIINKTRYLVREKNGLCFEVDIFKDENKGLVIAEIELEFEEQMFNKPTWLGTEVTGIKKYYNSYLSRVPFDSW